MYKYILRMIGVLSVSHKFIPVRRKMVPKCLNYTMYGVVSPGIGWQG